MANWQWRAFHLRLPLQFHSNLSLAAACGGGLRLNEYRRPRRLLVGISTLYSLRLINSICTTYRPRLELLISLLILPATLSMLSRPSGNFGSPGSPAADDLRVGTV